ncbi:MAG: hypothetical protein JW709_09220 [Sedimentisphaerales bacterium]|nr:hypothetical protein [Sedimentisphaerales bacterium]
MPGLSEIATGHWSLKGLVASMILVFVGGAMTIYDQFFDNTSGHGPTTVTLKCLAPDCGYTQEMSIEEFRELTNAKTQEWMQQNNITMPEGGGGPEGMMDPMMMGMMPSWGQPYTQWGLVCPQCQKNSFYLHTVCPKCGEIFLENPQNAGAPDKCPKCGYSRIEERRKERQEKKQAEREAKRDKRKSKSQSSD